MTGAVLLTLAVIWTLIELHTWLHKFFPAKQKRPTPPNVKQVKTAPRPPRIDVAQLKRDLASGKFYRKGYTPPTQRTVK